MTITLCWIEGVEKPIVYEGEVSKSDRRAIEAAYPGLSVNWGEKEV
ncbi:unnamed protein product [marine sediment metagenome]|uniref:Uncharacterized protein n=1 Tax=marine sediment metagenome TaxID=412755 RepID=X0VF56_9ZZZZ